MASSSAVVLLSGGIDSVVLLHYVVRRLKCAPVHALSIHYGQRHARELACAAIQAECAGAASHQTVEMSFIAPLIAPGTALVQGGSEVPSLDALPQEALDQPPTYVPNRNMLMLSMAAAYAEAQGVCDLYYGAQAQDEYGYWDCTAEFLDRINAVLALNRRTPVSVHAPFVRQSKADNVRLGLELGVDFAQTWSCYRGGALACGTCPTCVERLHAFEACGVADPIPYDRAR